MSGLLIIFSMNFVPILFSFADYHWLCYNLCSYSEVRVSLWGERTSAFVVDQAINPDGGKPIIVLLVGCLMKKYQGILCLHLLLHNSVPITICSYLSFGVLFRQLLS